MGSKIDVLRTFEELTIPHVLLVQRYDVPEKRVPLRYPRYTGLHCLLFPQCCLTMVNDSGVQMAMAHRGHSKP